MTTLEAAAMLDELAERRAAGKSSTLAGLAASAASAVAESGIPIPPPAAILRGGFADKLRRLEVGQSLLIQRSSTDGLHGYWRHLAPMKFVSRRISDDEVRIWRTA